METRLITIYDIKDIKLDDYIIVNRTWITQKYFDIVDDSFYYQEGIVTEIDIINNNFILDNNDKTIYVELESNDYSAFIQKRVDVIVID